MTAISKRKISEMKRMAGKVVLHHFGKNATDLHFLPAGKTNFVFSGNVGKECYVIRIARNAQKLSDFTKEQWVINQVQKKGVPVPEILEVGMDIIPYPYMLQRKIDGIEATHHPGRLDILFQLGKFARKIHAVPTSGFGTVFNWSQNQLSKNDNMREFLKHELNAQERLAFLKQYHLLDNKKLNKLRSYIEKISKWKFTPSLNHSDLRLKNVIVNDAGKIRAIIDWEHCSSNIAPYWDLSIALHDLSIDGKHRFLEGYGVFNSAELEKHRYALVTFNFLNYVPVLQKLVKRKNKQILELYKMRLNGDLDLFSL